MSPVNIAAEYVMNITMKWPWPPPRRGDVLGVTFVLAILCMIAVFALGFPNVMSRSTNAGFGPDWDCTQTGNSGPVCVKKLGAKP
jgi:hypothetical protein